MKRISTNVAVLDLGRGDENNRAVVQKTCVGRVDFVFNRTFCFTVFKTQTPE